MQTERIYRQQAHAWPEKKSEHTESVLLNLLEATLRKVAALRLDPASSALALPPSLLLRRLPKSRLGLGSWSEKHWEELMLQCQ